jgi:hypothetical protein
VPRPLAAALLGLASAAVPLLSTAAAAASWRAPVSGRVVRSFHYSPRTPFARGARRGVDLLARRGETVVSPCSGRVTFSGSVPRFGPALSVRCGALVATLLGVRAARRGSVRGGQAVGIATGIVRLGARRAGARFGYLDPLELLAAVPSHDAPLGGAPRGAPRIARPGGAPVAVRAAPGGAAPIRAAPTTLPWTAWAGLGLLVAGVPAGALVRRGARRGRRTGVAVGHR